MDNVQLLSLIFFFKGSLHCPHAGFLPSNVRQILNLLDSGEGWGNWRGQGSTFGTLCHTAQSQGCLEIFLLALELSSVKASLHLEIEHKE